jgi:hypothetical protein
VGATLCFDLAMCLWTQTELKLPNANAGCAMDNAIQVPNSLHRDTSDMRGIDVFRPECLSCADKKQETRRSTLHNSEDQGLTLLRRNNIISLLKQPSSCWVIRPNFGEAIGIDRVQAWLWVEWMQDMRSAARPASI